MKRRLSAAIAIMVLFGVCLLAGACTTKIGGTAESDAAIHPLLIANDPALDTSEPPVNVSTPEPTLTPMPTASVGITTPQNSASFEGAAIPVLTPTTAPIAVPTITPPSSPTASQADPIPAASEKPKKTGVVSIPVLNYHSIGVKKGSTLVLDPEKFARQMEYLAEKGYNPLSLNDFTLILEKQKSAPAKPVLLTFDDGYADNYEKAMPILKHHGFSATIFISPGSIGQEGKLNWEQVKEMQKAGWDIQPHGMTHPHLPELSPTKQKEEISQARQQIEQQLGTKADIFCYPYGEFNKQTLTILKEEGFRYAFTIQQGRTTSSQDPFQLKRIYVNAQESLAKWSGRLDLLAG